MRLDHALKKIGVTIVKSSNSDNRVVMFLRVSKDSARWIRAVEEFLLAHAERGVKWTPDVCRAYFVSPEKAVKYLWRVTVSGETAVALKDGVEAFGNAVVRAMSEGVEVTSVPLIGRKEYVFDPANGKTKGAHASGTAEAVVSAAGVK